MSKLFPSPDILLIPGGMGTRREMNNPRMLDWLRSSAEGAELVFVGLQWSADAGESRTTKWSKSYDASRCA